MSGRTVMRPLGGDEDFLVASNANPLDVGVRLWSKVRGPWSSGLDEDGRPFVIGEGDCWLWTASSNAGGFRIVKGRRRAVTRPGYGRLRFRGSDGTWTMIGAHVAAYLLVNGPFEDGLEIDHTCSQTLCCNPAHLRAVTHPENVRAIYERRRGNVAA